MLLKALTEKNNELLSKQDFSGYIKSLYELGVLLENEYAQAIQHSPEGTFPEESNKKRRFFRYVDYYFRFKFLRFSSKQSLLTRLWYLKIFLIAWEDPALRQQQDKQLRQFIKLKADIDKSIRRTIHAALLAEVIRLQTEVGIFIEKDWPSIHFNAELNAEGLNAALINHLTDCIDGLQSETPTDIHQIYDKAAQAITCYKPSADKFLHGLSVVIGLLAALACGLATSGFLFLLVSSFGAPLGIAALSGLLMFTASTYANFRLFSAHSSQFLRNLAKSGSITEFIDGNGKRQQLSGQINCLLVLGALLSLGVGLSSASLTILFGMALIATLFPTLGITLSGIIISALVIGMTIGLSLIIFKAWVYLVTRLRSSFSSWQGFLEKMTIQIKAMKHLTVTQWLGYCCQVALVSFALFGSFFLCFTGIPSLVPAFAKLGSWIVGLAAFLGDLPFTIMSISSFCSNFMKLFSRNDSNDTSGNPAFPRANRSSLLNRIGHVILLVANAAGRSIQVFDGKLISGFAAVACFFSALDGTLSKSNNANEMSRNNAHQNNKELLDKQDPPIAESVDSVASNSGRHHYSFNSSSPEFFVVTSLAASSANSVAESDSVSLKIR